MKNTINTSFALLAVAALALTGCTTTASDETPVATTAAEVVTITDAWVKAADEGMSAAFGELGNAGDTDVTVVSVSSEASSMLELHETVTNDEGSMVMQPKDGGFIIPAGGSLSLAPGGNHIMLMSLTNPLLAGDEATFTLTFSDGSTFTFTAPVKDYSGANESYEGGESEMDMDMDSDMDMGEHN